MKNNLGLQPGLRQTTDGQASGGLVEIRHGAVVHVCPDWG